MFCLEEPNVAQMQQRLKRCEKSEQEKSSPITMGYGGMMGKSSTIMGWYSGMRIFRNLEMILWDDTMGLSSDDHPVI